MRRPEGPQGSKRAEGLVGERTPRPSAPAWLAGGTGTCACEVTSKVNPYYPCKPKTGLEMTPTTNHHNAYLGLVRQLTMFMLPESCIK